jgi:hypothetical protein
LGKNREVKSDKFFEKGGRVSGGISSEVIDGPEYIRFIT